MEFFQAIVLGVIEGLSEFLPISSTGHLILASDILGIKNSDFIKSFNIFIQSGAILAVLVLYGRELIFRKDLIYKVFIAFLPTAVVGLVFYKLIKEFLLGNTQITLWALFLGGIILIALEMLFKRRKTQRVSSSSITFKKAFFVGLVQSISIIPGVSRSAASIVGGMIFGMDRSLAVEFSFLLAIPTLFAATGLDLVSSSFNFTPNEWLLLTTGFLTSFAVAILVMKWFMNYVKKYTFIAFGVYRIVAAALFFLLILK